MCLDFVDKEPRTDVKYAYKVFRKGGKSTYYPLHYVGKVLMFLSRIWFNLFWYLYTHFARGYEIGDWHQSSKREIRATDSAKYSSGFHCYVNKRDALWLREYLIGPALKVAVEDIVASGRQDERDVIVARRMKLIEEVD